MKECRYCNTIVDDGLIICPNCKRSWFKNSTAILSSDVNEIIKQTLNLSNLNLTDNKTLLLTRQIRDYYEKNHMPITIENLGIFLKKLNR